MKKLLLLISTAVFIFSCSKGSDDDIVPIKETYPITFTPTGFNSSLTILKNEESNPNTFDYVVFTEAGVYVKYIRFTNGDAIEDNLEPGNYTVTILAHSNPDNSSISTNDDYNSCYFYCQYFTEASVYMGKTLVKIEEGNNVKTIELQRVSGRLEVVINDLTSEADHYKIEAENMPNSIWFSPTRGSDGSINMIKEGLAVNFIAPNLIENEPQLKNVVITVYDVNNTELISRRVVDVPLAPNRLTTLTGNIYENNSNSNSSFTTILLDEWGTPINKNF